ncbi:DUF262 domain-containing protein [Bradyrhizobium sp. CCGUVB14]|uniref:DUF262 domain-containing protein n=1 Tax=Bradyrhizobium sp. CCGUVB14 TaxID=2949628 RepID=UPI0020B425EB|nr:DUF262 domain-containing protein [Bradyrhizobium sp. CCGUVB14]MCP3447210.1 DUF262 domain-containing protein [Bradyrhizobium sp. CCGUVB14]
MALLSWTSKQGWDLFFRNPWGGRKNHATASPYFLGSIALIKPKAEVVDGQQS